MFFWLVKELAEREGVTFSRCVQEVIKLAVQLKHVFLSRELLFAVDFFTIRGYNNKCKRCVLGEPIVTKRVKLQKKAGL